MDLAELHRRAAESFDGYVQIIREDQWGDPTPCSEWSVRDLVNHLTYEDRWAPDLLAKKTIEEVGDRYEGDLLGADPKASWGEAHRAAVAAIETEGALEGEVHVSWGQIPAAEYVGQLFLDHLVHGWDLAKGIGADDELDPELCTVAYEMIRNREKEIRGSGVYGEDLRTSDDADAQTKLLAFLGRRR